MISIGAVDRRTLILGGAALVVAGAAAGWYFFGEELLSPAPPPTVAKAPAKAPAKPAAPAAKPEAGAPAAKPEAGAPAKPAAKPAADNPDQAVAEVISRSGLAAFGEQFRQSAIQGMEAAPNRPAKLTAQEAQAYRQAVDRVLAAEKTNERVRAQLRKAYDPARFAQFIELLRRPINEKMTKLELEQPAPEQVKQFFEKQRSSPPSKEREELIRGVDAAGRISETAGTMSVVVIRAMLEGALLEQPAGGARAGAPGNVEQQLAPMRQAVQTQTRALLAYVYRNASDAELKEYAGLFQSEAGRWGTALIANAVQAAVDDAARELGGEIARIGAEQRQATAATAQEKEKPPASEAQAAARPSKAESSAEERPASARAAGAEPPTQQAAIDPARRAAAAERRRASLPPVYSRYNDLITAVTMQDHASAQELLSDGKNPNARASTGHTALMIAVELRDLEMVNLLLARGANPNLSAPGGATAMRLAREAKSPELMSLLASHGAKE